MHFLTNTLDALGLDWGSSLDFFADSDLRRYFEKWVYKSSFFLSSGGQCLNLWTSCKSVLVPLMFI